MKLTYTPLSPHATAMPESIGEESAVRAHAANILRSARRTSLGTLKPRELRPRNAGKSGLWKLANGLLQLCW